MWPLVLAPSAGRLPQDEATLVNLQESLRHQGHISELNTRGGPGNTTLAGHYAEEDHHYHNDESYHSQSSPPAGGNVGTDTHVFPCVDDDGWP